MQNISLMKNLSIKWKTICSGSVYIYKPLTCEWNQLTDCWHTTNIALLNSFLAWEKYTACQLQQLELKKSKQTLNTSCKNKACLGTFTFQITWKNKYTVHCHEGDFEEELKPQLHILRQNSQNN